MWACCSDNGQYRVRAILREWCTLRGVVPRYCHTREYCSVKCTVLKINLLRIFCTDRRTTLREISTKEVLSCQWTILRERHTEGVLPCYWKGKPGFTVRETVQRELHTKWQLRCEGDSIQRAACHRRAAMSMGQYWGSAGLLGGEYCWNHLGREATLRGHCITVGTVMRESIVGGSILREHHIFGLHSQCCTNEVQCAIVWVKISNQVSTNPLNAKDTIMLFQNVASHSLCQVNHPANIARSHWHHSVRKIYHLQICPHHSNISKRSSMISLGKIWGATEWQTFLWRSHLLGRVADYSSIHSCDYTFPAVLCRQTALAPTKSPIVSSAPHCTTGGLGKHQWGGECIGGHCLNTGKGTKEGRRGVWGKERLSEEQRGAGERTGWQNGERGKGKRDVSKGGEPMLVDGECKQARCKGEGKSKH